MDKLRVRYPVVVEGKYDKATLLSLLDTPVFALGGFAVYHNEKTRALLRRLAGAGPVILLTDSDGGGRQIRAFLSGILPPDRVIHLFIPRIPGKEKRKAKPGKAGLLGVEGMPPDVLRRLFAPFLENADAPAREPVTKADLFALGLSGAPDSAEKRAAISRALELPDDLPANAFLSALNLVLSREEFFAFVRDSGQRE